MKLQYNRILFLFLFSLYTAVSFAQIAPVLHSGDNKTATGTGTSLTINKPDNVASGDLIVLMFATQRSAENDDVSGFTIPDGFTLIKNEQDIVAHNRPEVAVYYKIAGDSEPAHYSSTLTQFTDAPRWSAVAMRVTGHDPLNPVLVRSGANSGNMNATGLSLPSINITTANSLIVGTLGVRRAITDIEIPGEVADEKKLVASVAGDGVSDDNSNRPALFVATHIYRSLGSTGVRNYSWSGAAKAAGVLFAIKPDITSADLMIEVEVDETTPQRGHKVVFSLKATNNGYADATGVGVKTDVPAGYLYESNSVSKGDYDAELELWLIDDLSSGETATMELTLLVTCSTDDEHDLKLTIEGNQPDSDQSNNEQIISVNPQGTCPVIAIPDNLTVEQGSPGVINVLDNDLLGDFDPTTFGTSNIITEPSNGSLIVGANGQVTYLPNGNFVGQDQFRYEICSAASPSQCSQAVVTITVEPDLFDVCKDAVREKTYYLPFPETNDLLNKALVSAASSNPNLDVVRNVVSIKINYPKTVIVYDHWEDGYEADITNPQQPTTEVWGDGDPSNGVAPGYPDDIIPAGGEIIIDETFRYDRSQFTIEYDGRDKIYSTNDIAISKVTGSADHFRYQNVKTDVIDTDRFGRSFTIGFGEDMAAQHPVFRYVGAFIRAAEDDTFVELDYDGDGVVDVTRTLNEGEVWLYDGTANTPGNTNNVNRANDIKAGARVISDKPVGVDIVFGGIDYYGTRNLYILPAQFYGSEYLTPLHTTRTTAPVLAYFYNSSANPVTVDWEAGTGQTGSIVLPSRGINFLSLEHDAGYSFKSTNDEPFTAVVVIDADSDGAAYDWAYTMVPTERLTNFAAIAWAPGSLDLSANYNPIWVTTQEPTTIYVKWDGDLSDENATNITPCGLPYDEAHNINALQSLKLYDNSDNDQSGAAVFTCPPNPNDPNSTAVPFAAVWGQDAGVAPIGDEALDVGYLMIPRCLDNLIVANDDMEVTEPDEPVLIDILNNDAGYLCTVDHSSVMIVEQPANGTVEVHSDGRVTYTPNSGFMGEDVFTYSVCSNEYLNTCDEAKVTINVRSCEDGAGSAGVNVIRGRVFVDQSPYSGVYDSSKELVGGVMVHLYADKNCNGVIDSEDELLESTVSSSTGRFIFETRSDTYARDEFASSSNAFSQNDGTVNWQAAWSRTNTQRITSQVDAVPGDLNNRAMRLGSDVTASRAMAFTGATGGALRFKVRRENVTVANSLTVSVNGNMLITITDDAGSDLIYEEIIIPINEDWLNMNGNNTISFATNNLGSSRYYFIDDVEFMQFPSCFIVQVDPSNVSDKYEATAIDQYETEFSRLGSCADYDYLGVKAVIIAEDDSGIRVLTDVPKIIDVLDNDKGNPDPSSVEITEQPQNGIVTVNPDGTITYAPNAGYNGTDTFKYKVCSVDDPGVCDEAEVSLTVTCATIPGKNVISGVVFGDNNSNIIYDTGEMGIGAIPLELYNESGDKLTETVTDAVGGYQFEMDCAAELDVKDDFSVSDYSNNSGMVEWRTPWIETNDNNSPVGGNIYITTDERLRVQGNGSATQVSISRSADLSGAVSAQLSYRYEKSSFNSSWSSRDYVDVEISSDGVNWTRLKRFSGRTAASGNDSFDISEHISPNTTIRLSEAATTYLTSGEYVIFDDIEISYVAVPEQGFYARDKFAAKSYNNNDGTVNWGGDWLESDNNNPATGSIFINDNGQLRVQGDGLNAQKSIQRKVNLQNVSQATLIYSYEKSTFSHNSYDWVEVQISLNGTSNWHTLKRYSNTAAVSGNEVIDIPTEYYGENSTIRIIESNNGNFTNGEYVLFSNFTVLMNYNKYIVKLKQPLPGGYAATSAVEIPVEFSSCGLGSCSNNFGLTAADMDIEKTADNMNPPVGGEVVFTVKAWNKGPGDATQVVIEDKLESGYEYLSHTVSHDPSKGDYDPVSGEWTIDIIDIGETFELKITVKVLEPVTGISYENSAEVTHQIPEDPDDENNKSTITPEPECLPELELTKVSLSTDYDEPGDLLQFELTLKNSGNVAIENPEVTDPEADSPPVYVSGDTNSNDILDVGEEWIYSAEYTVTQYNLDFGYYKNIATASGDPTCGTLGEVTASATVYAEAKPDFTLVKEAVSAGGYKSVGEKLFYTYKLTNTGNVSLDYFTIDDDKIGTLPPVDVQIAVGDDYTVTAEYTVTQADMDAGEVKNIAEAVTEYNDVEYKDEDWAIVYRMIMNYWLGNQTSNPNAWADADNWTANTVPLPGENIEFATDDNNGPAGDGNGKGAAEAHLHLDTDRVIGDLINDSDMDLVVTTENQLIIEGEVHDKPTASTSKGTIVVEAATDKASGTLLFKDPAKNANVDAKVEFYNQAHYCDDCGFYKKQWQYFGIPVKESAFPYLTPKVETVNQWVEPFDGDKWRPAPYAPDTQLKAFKGYEITNSSQTKPTHIYQFTGQLNVGNQPLVLTKSANVNYSGMNLFANSFTGAIPINSTALGIDDSANILDDEIEKTVYLFNTGTRDQWRKMNGGTVTGTAAGRYTAVPIQVSGMGGLPDRILSMHSFMLNAKSGGSITLSYLDGSNDLVLLKNEVKTDQPAWRSADNSDNSGKRELPYIVLDVIGEGSADRVWLFEEPTTTLGFDNGWDGLKMLESDLIQLYAIDEEQNKYQVSTVPQLDGMVLGVAARENESYTISVATTEDMELRRFYLHDTFTGRGYLLRDGADIMIPATHSANLNRFVITQSVLPPHMANASLINTYVHNNTIVVENRSEENATVSVFDTSGRFVGKAVIAKEERKAFPELSMVKGVLVVKIVSDSGAINRADRVLLR